MRNSLASIHATLLQHLTPFQVVLENARWPVQRLDSFRSANEPLSAKQLSLVASQMLQISFNFDHEYFALRSLPNTTQIEVRRGALINKKSPINILGEATFDENYSGTLIRPCNINGNEFLCLIDFSIKRDFMPTKKRSYTVIALRNEDIFSSGTYGSIKTSLFGLSPSIGFKVGSQTFSLSQPYYFAPVLHHTTTIDEGVSLEASIGLWPVVRLSFLLTVGLYLGGFGLLGFISKRTHRRLKARMDSLLTKSRLEHLEELQSFVRGVIHDIKSPIAALKACSDSVTNPDSRRLLDHAIKRMTMMIRDLEKKGHLLKIESDMVSLPLARVLRLVAMEKSREFPNRQPIQINGAIDDLWVRGPYSDFLRTMSNLLNNAIEASAPTSPIYLECSVYTPGKVRIRVIDQGKGIPKDIVVHIFSEGVSFGKKGGTGIGLAHARNTVNRMGGDFQVETEVGKGTTMNIDLPLIDKPLWALSRLDLSKVEEIFVVDDEEGTYRVWLEKLRLKSLSIQYFAHPSQLPNSGSGKSILFLVDNRFGAEDDVGLEFIGSNRKHSNVLVTSDWHTSSVQAKVSELSVPLIGKEFIDQLEVAA